MSTRIIKNIFSSWGMFLIISLIQFFLTPLFIHKLGDSEYGIWILIVSLIGYLELLNLGLNTANVRFLSRNFETKDYNAANEIFNSGLFIFLFLGIIVLILVFAMAPFLGHVFKFMDNLTYKIIFIIAGVNLAFELSFYAFSAVLSGRQMFVEANIIITSVFILRSLAAIFLLLTGFKLFAIVINQAAFNILRGMIISIYSLKINPELKISFHYVSKVAIKTIAGFSVYIFIMNISRKVNMYTSSLIIAFFLSPGAITYYSIANSLINYLQEFISAIPNVLIPRFSQLEAANNHEGVRDYYLSFTRITLILSVPIVFLFFFYGGSFISLWIGPRYAELSGSILAVLSIGALCQISQVTTYSVLKATSRHIRLSYFTIMESTSVVILSLLLVKPYGLMGLAYAQAIGTAFVNLTVVPIYACQELKINIVNYYTKYLFNNLINVVPLLIVSYFLKSSIINSIPMFGIIAMTIVSIFLVSSYLFILNYKEKQMLTFLVRLK